MLSEDARSALRHYGNPQPHTVPKEPKVVHFLIREGYIDCQGGLTEYGQVVLTHITEP